VAAGPPKFSDGEAYERMMGRWSRVAGEAFLDWIALSPGLRLLDVGCGNGAFTELLVERCAPSDVQAIDPSEGQLAFARRRPNASAVGYRQGVAQALPFGEDRFDAAVMALAINFVPDPQHAVTEMARVVRPAGLVATYVWDIAGGGFPMEPIRRALDETGVPTPLSGTDVTRTDRLRDVWAAAGLDDVASERIDVRISYPDFDDFWDANTGPRNTVSNAVAALAPANVEALKARLRAALPMDSNGRVSYGAVANAVRGRVKAATR